MSTQTLWIVVAAVVVVLLLIALVVGLVVARNRRINLRPDDEPETGEKRPPTGGTYQAGSGFSFSSGTATAPERPRAGDPTTTAPPDGSGTTAPAAPAPEAPAPDGSVPDGSAPDGSAPDGSAPDGSAPDGSVPDGSVPDGSAPDGSVPDGSVPDGSVPDGSVPDGSVPDGSVPDGSVPDGSVPDGSVPDGSVPDGSVPDGSAPGGSTSDGLAADGSAPGGPGASGSAPGGSAAGTAPPDAGIGERAAGPRDDRPITTGTEVRDGGGTGADAGGRGGGAAVEDRPAGTTGTGATGTGASPGTPKSGVIDTAEASKDPATARLDPRAAPPATPERLAPEKTTPGTSAPDASDPSASGSGVSAPAPSDPAIPEAPQKPDRATPAKTTPGRHAATEDTGTGDTVSRDTAPRDTAPRDTAPRDTATPAATPPVGTAAPSSPKHAAPAETSPGAPAEEIAPAEGRLGRLRGRLSRSRSGLGQSLLGLLGAGQMDEESWEDVEATLLQADLGPETTGEIVGKLREQLAARAVRTADGARAVLHDVLTEALDTGQDRSVRALPHDGRPAVLLVVGVNGTGKTTTTGKLARVLVAGGHRVTLGAADTFRAAAAEQLVTWGERAGAGVVRGPEGSDPASVAFDAVKRGTTDGVDAVLLDTAGRLHTKTGLMDELGKVKRVVEKQARVDEVLLVLDATTGQNGLTQARVFGDVVAVTGIALTKLDGTAKGGIVFRVQRELGVPVKLVGLGEGPDDLAPFEPSAFVDALLN